MNKLTTLIKPCVSGACPALYRDEEGKVFVQGNKLSKANREGILIPDYEDVVELTPELINYLRSAL